MSALDDDEPLEGILRNVLINHQDNEVTGLLVIVFEQGEASVYNSNIKPEIIESIAALLGPQPDG